MNKADSERITGALEKQGYSPAPAIEKADLVVTNMCSVRQSAVNRVFGLSQKLSRLKVQNPRFKTILTGCMLPADRKKFENLFDHVLKTSDLIENKWYHELVRGTICYVPISNGCNNSCSYCVVPSTRGHLICRNHKEILREIKVSAKNGAQEIWLLGQNVNDYRSPSLSSVNFAKLLEMAEEVAGNFRLIFISPHPKVFSEELINVLAKSKKFGGFLNLPVQSGDDEVLKKMNRPYTIAQYKNLVKKIRQKMPGINLSTDIIVGFPGETKKQFASTSRLMKEMKFDWAYISKYSPRPGTRAFQLKDDVPLEEKKRREKILREIIKQK